MSDEWVEVSHHKKKSNNVKSNNSISNNSNGKKNCNNYKKNGNQNNKEVNRNDNKNNSIQSNHNNGNNNNKIEIKKDDIDENNTNTNTSIDINDNNGIDMLDTEFDKMQINSDDNVINNNDDINDQLINNEKHINVYKPTLQEFCITSRDILIQFFNNSDHSSTDSSNVRCVGMLNTGNACYRNCVIQILLSLPPFYYTLNHLVELYPVSNLPIELKGWRQILTFFVEYKKKIYKNGKLISALTKDIPVLNPEYYLRDLFETFKSKVHPNGVPTVTVSTKGKGKSVKQISSQEDSQEFLTFFLDTLDEEMNSNSIKEEVNEKESSMILNEEESGWETVNKARVKEVVDDISREDAIRKSASTIISRLFHGTIRSEVIYTNKKISSRFQIVTQIQIELFELIGLQQKTAALKEQSRNNKKSLTSASISPSINISDAIKLYFAEEDLDTGTKKRVKLESAPQILILHLKRFTFDYSKNIPIKINNEVTYDVSLTIPMEYLSPDLMAKCIKNIKNFNSGDSNSDSNSDGDNDDSNNVSGIKYRLIGLILHHGNHATGGHYTTIAKETDNSWKSMDDSSAKYISQKEALDGKKQVYLLFYEKI